jgi:hypothetical protein
VKVGAEEGAVVMVSPKVPVADPPPVPAAARLILFRTPVVAPTGIVPEITQVDVLRLNPKVVRVEAEVVLYVTGAVRPEDWIVYE